VLVGAADVRRDDLEDDAVLALAPDVVGVNTGSVLQLELREVDRLDFDLAGAEIGDTSVVGRALSLRWGCLSMGLSRQAVPETRLLDSGRRRRLRSVA
jgi:hypothetical protein